MLRRRANRNPILLDDIANAVPICRNWPKAEEAQSGVTTVRSGNDGGAERGVAGVGENGGELVGGCRTGGRIIGRWVEVAMEFALEEAIESVEVPILTQALAALPRELDVSLASLLQRSNLLRGCGIRVEDLQPRISTPSML